MPGVTTSRRLALLGLASLALSLAGCTKPEPPKITPKSARLVAISNVGMEVAIALDVENPNGIDLDAKSVDAKLVLDDTLDVGRATIERGVHLPAHKTVPLEVPVSMRWKSMTDLLPFAMRESVPYKVVGEVQIGGALSIGIPFTIKGTLGRNDLAKLALSAIPGLPGLK